MSCDRISRTELGFRCRVRLETNFSSQEYRIASANYSRVQELYISFFGPSYMENIQFLPIANRFIRNLIRYEGRYTQVRTILKENFDGMIWLEELVLTSNWIETIMKDTFQGLENLQIIRLGKRI